MKAFEPSVRTIAHNEIKPGTHITAMGSDTPNKIELDPVILQKAVGFKLITVSRLQLIAYSLRPKAYQKGVPHEF